MSALVSLEIKFIKPIDLEDSVRIDHAFEDMVDMLLHGILFPEWFVDDSFMLMPVTPFRSGYATLRLKVTPGCNKAEFEASRSQAFDLLFDAKDYWFLLLDNSKKSLVLEPEVVKPVLEEVKEDVIAEEVVLEQVVLKKQGRACNWIFYIILIALALQGLAPMVLEE